MDQLSQSQYKIILEFQNRLSQCNNQQKQLQIREANIDQNTDEDVSNSCTPEKVLQPVMLKSNLKQINQNSYTKKPLEAFKCQSFAEHLYQNSNQTEQNRQHQGLNEQQYATLSPFQQYQVVQKERNNQEIQDTINASFSQNQARQNTQQNQFLFQQKLQTQINYEDDQNEENCQLKTQKEIGQFKQFENQNSREFENNQNTNEDEDNEYKQVLSSERKQNLYVVWQLNQKRSRQYSLQEEQLQKIVDQEEQLQNKTFQIQSDYQQSKEQETYQNKSVRNQQQKIFDCDLNAKRINQASQQQECYQRFIDVDKENYIPNTNLQAAKEQLLREINESNQKEQQAANYKVNQQNVLQSRDQSLKSTSQFGNQNIPTNRSKRTFSVENVAKNQISQQQPLIQFKQLSNMDTIQGQNQMSHQVSFGQSLNIEQAIKQDVNVKFEVKNAQKSRIQVASIKEIEKLITQQDNHPSELSIIPQQEFSSRQPSQRNSSQKSLKKNQQSVQSSQLKQLPPKSAKNGRQKKLQQQIQFNYLKQNKKVN
ncbi:hypothetical protein TTHERM_00713530 (macronuclear) [Tetrahymena thermophila SB210]|uniref:Uncharacterized protein n=1 Tax=Tetrahymena thermophila (strain SB210) TaxID=312017 RepID=Q24CU9_TETTS|nr:hypothetical protein TTHERM_00713530 [Tetrahymena thermophila SB210]EAS05659.1 hypothetical protein TTHERM_00713530 [Tetrahymena thermophila SB210]|eukprot:XP_001025904.1 hypothetical protein TTHERM_00713530 [Tetrahymena thermophila SB210]